MRSIPVRDSKIRPSVAYTGHWMDVRGLNNTPRDTWLNPVAGFSGILDLVRFDDATVEERIAAEFEANQKESRQAIQAVGNFHFLLILTYHVLIRFHHRRSVAHRISHQS